MITTHNNYPVLLKLIVLTASKFKIIRTAFVKFIKSVILRVLYL